MSKCGVNRVCPGPGTIREKPSNPQAVKELQTQLESLMSQRNKQDAMWTQAEQADPKENNKPDSNKK